MGETPTAAKEIVDSASLASVLEQLVSGSTTSDFHLQWPPNVFAICAYLLKLTGSYVDVLQKWPPDNPWKTHNPSNSWEEWIRTEGIAWRSVAINSNAKPPMSVVQLWNQIAAASNRTLKDVAKDDDFVFALLQLVAISDAACAGVGIPQSSVAVKNLLCERAIELLAGIGTGENYNSTLSPLVNQSLVRVLPKQHTPRGGLTLRSLTHHLALHVGSEVEPFWRTVPQSTSGNSLNLLVAPWPLSIRPSQFQPVQGAVDNMPKKFGYVQFIPAEDKVSVTRWTKALIAEAVRVGGRVDGVVFPETSLSDSEYLSVKEVVLEHGAFLIAGVLRKNKNGPPSNLVMFDAVNLGQPIHVEQQKHHRWRLDRGQIEMYGLGGTLDPDWNWWEHIAVDRRKIYFLTLNKQLSLCCLACEDLARQDPVAELVRSVGPNLVVALLMDAPQLNVRWPARYATVLADDPGSSVLTVTSAGMVDLTRTPRSGKPSRSVGLWKDARSDSVELELPTDAAGLLLNICTELVEEWTADGRSDRGTTGYPRLGGVHALRIEQQVDYK